MLPLSTEKDRTEYAMPLILEVFELVHTILKSQHLIQDSIDLLPPPIPSKVPISKTNSETQD